MFAIALLVLIIVVAVVALLEARRPTTTGRPVPPRTGRPGAPAPTPGPELAPRLDRWVRAGLITGDESAAIETYEATGGGARGPEPTSLPGFEATAGPVAPVGPAPVRIRSARVPIVAEALGYLGAALASTGLLLVVVHLWGDLATAGRLGLSGGAAVLLAGAGLAVHEGADPALTRLRAVLWLAATAAAGIFAGVLADALGAESETAVGASAATMVAFVSGVMWAWRERPLQELVALVAVPVAVGGWVFLVATPLVTGIAVWITGALLFAVGVRLRTPLPWITESVGAVALLIGSVMVSSEIEGVGLFVVLVTGVALVAVAVVRGLAPSQLGQVIAGVFGAVAALQVAPPLTAWYAQEAGVVTGLVVWLAGVGLIALGWSARTRLPLVFEVLGALVTVAGAAVCGAQAPGFAALFGIANAIALLALGMRPGRVLLSAIGSLGLLVNVPWAIGWFFPGENRAPLLIMVSGALIIGAAVLMTRLAGRFRREIGHPHPA